MDFLLIVKFWARELFFAHPLPRYLVTYKDDIIHYLNFFIGEIPEQFSCLRPSDLRCTRLKAKTTSPSRQSWKAYIRSKMKKGTFTVFSGQIERVPLQTRSPIILQWTMALTPIVLLVSKNWGYLLIFWKSRKLGRPNFVKAKESIHA